MHLAESGEPLTVMTPEVMKDRLVGVHAEELADDLDREDLGVGKRWGGAALTDTPSFELIVYQAENGCDEGAKIHEKTSAASGTIESTPSVGRSSLWFKLSKKLAHGVS
jgi:hypothetical protein